MNHSLRLAGVAAAIATLSFASAAQVAQTTVTNGFTSTEYGAAGQSVSGSLVALPPTLSSLVGGVGAAHNSGLQLDENTSAVGSFVSLNGPQLNGLQSTYTAGGAANSTQLGTYAAGVLSSGFRNDGVLGTNAVLGDTAITGDLAVSGITATNGINNNGQIISNVAAGIASSDVSTVGQLNAATAAQAVTNARQAAFNNNIQAQTDANRRIASTGTAIVSAAASIPALESGKNVGVGVGVGGYDGRGAISFAVAARATQALQFKVHMGTGSGGKVAAGAGGLWAW